MKVKMWLAGVVMALALGWTGSRAHAVWHYSDLLFFFPPDTYLSDTYGPVFARARLRDLNKSTMRTFHGVSGQPNTFFGVQTYCTTDTSFGWVINSGQGVLFVCPSNGEAQMGRAAMWMP